MYRHWLFNPYPASGGAKRRGWGWLPSIRLHRIMHADKDRHYHDHPWHARTIILDGWYTEVQPAYTGKKNGQKIFITLPNFCATHHRKTGDTAPIKYEHYHKIIAVSAGGVTTVFITWRYRGDWGFLVAGKKMLWREYLANEKTL